MKLAFTFCFQDQQVLERVVEHSPPILAGRNHSRRWKAGVAMGQEPYTLGSVERMPTGVGRWPAERVVSTDSRSGQCALLPQARAAFRLRMLAFSPNIDQVDGLPRNGDTISMSDAAFELAHPPGHSGDPNCLYNEPEGVLFVGDSRLLFTSLGGSHQAGFRAPLEKLCARDVRRIYFGHGPPLTEGCNQRLCESQRLAATSALADGR